MDLSKAELEPFLAASGTLDMLRKNGNLQAHEGATEFAASQPGWAVRAAHEIEFHHLDARGMADLQPGLSRQFTMAPLPRAGIPSRIPSNTRRRWPPWRSVMSS